MAQALKRNCSFAGFRSELYNHSSGHASHLGHPVNENTKDVNDLEVGEYHPNFCYIPPPIRLHTII